VRLVPLEINEWLSVPDELVSIRATRAGGPGGQNVNKVSSRVELLIDLVRWTALPPDARQRLEARERRRISREGTWRIVCQLHRDQTRNREACLESLRRIVRECLVSPPRRRATRPSRSARQRRLESKRIRGATKRLRTRPPGD
jgi:ribosome-associated protein